MAHVAICTPHGGFVKPTYYRHLLSMQSQWPQHTFYHMELDLMIVGKARNVLIQEVLSRIAQAEVVLYVDNDVKAPENTGQLVTDVLQLGIVSGVYYNRHQPYTPQVYKFSTRAGELGMYEPVLELPKTGFMMVDAVGAGLFAIHRDVLVDIQTKYEARLATALEEVRHKLRNDGHTRQEFEWLVHYAKDLSPWFEFLDKRGEDMYFCERARETQHAIWVNVDVKAKHMSEVDIGEEHFNYLVSSGLLVRMGPDGKPVEEPKVLPGSQEQEQAK